MRLPSIETTVIFAALTLLFGALTGWIIHNNYMSEVALYNWSSIRSILDAESLRLENLGFSTPHGPMLVLMPFAMIPWLGVNAPYMVSVLVTAFLLTHWNRNLQQGGYSLTQRLLLLGVLLAHPGILWGASGGGNEAVSLLMFYLLYRACLRMVYEKDIRAFIAMGIALAAFAYFEVISLFIFVALLPLLLLIVPTQMMKEAPLSVYIVIGMPLFIVAGAWLYFNWIFLGDPWAFLSNYESAFMGARTHAETLPWLREYGGEFWRPMLVGLQYVIIGSPLIIFLMARSVFEGRQLRIALVLMLHPVIAIGLATAIYYLANPLQISVLLIAAIMAEVSRLECYRLRCYSAVLVLLIVGVVTSWGLFMRGGYYHIEDWTSALTSRQEAAYSGDASLGEWLKANREPTLIDLQSCRGVIAIRGDATELLLPFTREYRLAMRSELPQVKQIAVPDPSTERGRHDAINVRFPQLYNAGMAGYEIVYDEAGWRVFRQNGQL